MNGQFKLTTLHKAVIKHLDNEDIPHHSWIDSQYVVHICGDYHCDIYLYDNHILIVPFTNTTSAATLKLNNNDPQLLTKITQICKHAHSVTLH